MIYEILYSVLILIIVVMSAVMDGEAGIANYCKKKGWNKLYYWCDSTSWNNKYQLQEWMVSKGFQPWFAKWMAQDVFVIFTDMWHCAKAILFLSIEFGFLFAVNNLAGFGLTGLEFAGCLFLAFVIVGSIFNICYYFFESLAETHNL